MVFIINEGVIGLVVFDAINSLHHL